MPINTWDSALASKNRRRKEKKDRQSNARRLFVEPLEDRRMLATLTVNSAADNVTGGDGMVTLREAIIAANTDSATDLGQTGSGADEIVFDAALTAAGDATISLTLFDTGLDAGEVGPSAFQISTEISIVGSTGEDGIIIERDSGAADFRLFDIRSTGDLTLENLTLSGGVARGFEGGSGASVGSGGGGSAGLGGAVFNSGSLSILSSTLSGNAAIGGDGGFHGQILIGGVSGGGGAGLGAPGGNATGYSTATQAGNGGGPGGGVGGAEGNSGTGTPGGAGQDGTFGSGGGGGGNQRDGGDGGFGAGGGGGGGGFDPVGGPVGLDANGGNGGFGGGGGSAGFQGDTPGAGGFGAGDGGGPVDGERGGGAGAGMGGAIFNYGGTVTITSSTISGNSAVGGTGGSVGGGDGGGFGGGVFTRSGDVTVVQSTVASNTINGHSGSDGGSIFNLGDGGAATLHLDNSILAANVGGTNDVVSQTINGGTVADSGAGNLIESQSGLASVAIASTSNPLLEPLLDNGGPTNTHQLGHGSPAEDAGTNALAVDPASNPLTTDQRGTGFVRILTGTVDIGAFEGVAPPRPGPGGVSDDLSLWLKADAGVTESGGAVSQWVDQGANGFTSAQGTAANQPTLVADAVNFNPTVRFDGTNDNLIISGGILGSDTYDDLTVYTINTTNEIQNGYIFWEDTDTSRISTNLPWGSGTIFFQPETGNNSITAPFGGDVGQPYLWSLQHGVGGLAVGGNQAILRDGTSLMIDNSANNFTGNNGDFYFGSEKVQSSFHDADISEFIIFTGALTSAQHEQIQSYLAAKYAITIPHDLVDSQGSTFWDATANAAFQNDVAVIGRDDLSELDQQKSKSVNDDSLVVIDSGGAFANDQSFLAWGNNDGSTAIDTVSGSIMHMGRVWKVAESGTVGTVTVSIPASTDADNLLVDDDGDFSSGATEIALTPSGGDLMATVDLNDGQFLTFASAGDSFVITTATDENDGNPDPGTGAGTSLREAIIAANANPNPSTITFDASLNGMDVQLTMGQMVITEDLTIDGNGADNTVIDAQQNSRIFRITGVATNVTLDGLTLQNGRTTAQFEPGGAVQSVSSEELVIQNSSITGNSTTAAGSHGGAIWTSRLAVTGSTISGNSIAGDYTHGGAIYASYDATITNSTISGNSATGSSSYGGGVVSYAPLVITNSTITGNTASGTDGRGGGIYSSADLTIRNSIVAGNMATVTSPEIRSTGSLTVEHSIVGDNSGTGLAEDQTGASDNFIGTAANPIDPMLGGLQDNGGPTLTHALFTGSPAENAGDNALAVDPDTNPLTTDQRGTGFDRIVGGTVDIGAVEGVMDPPPAPDLSTVIQFSSDGMTFSDDLTAISGDEIWVRINYDNTGEGQATNAQASITLPTGISLVPNSTRTGLMPTQNETVTNRDAGQTGAIDESAVWTGDTLTIGPQAGLYTLPSDQTSGIIEFGKKAFINLHDCHYFNGAERFFVTADPAIAGTNVSNMLDAAAACAGTVGAYGLAGTELRSGSLLGNRYLNYHEGHFSFFSDNIYKDADGTATRTSNTIDAAPNIAGTAGAHIQDTESSVANLDLLGNRYINLHEGRFISGGDLISLNLGAGGTNTSNTPDAAPSFPATFGAYTLNDSALLALDTLDAARGAGFVEFKVDTLGALGNVDFTGMIADLSGNSEFANQMDTGTLTLDPGPDLFVVTTAVDENDGNANPGNGTGTSLREAILAANADTNESTITFDASLDGTPILLTITGSGEDAAATGDLDVSTEIIIRGNGPANTIIDAGGAAGLNDRVFDVDASGDLTLEDATVTGGTNVSYGGGIQAQDAVGVRVMDSVITGNSATIGGGGIRANTSSGGPVSVLRSAITSNSANSYGGGIAVTSGQLSVVDSTISGNSTSDAFGQGGGGISTNYGSDQWVINSTISGNSTASNYGGGGISNYKADLDVVNSTITGNSAPTGGGLTHRYASYDNTQARLSNTIVAGNTGGDLGGHPTELANDLANIVGGHNLVQDGSDTGTGLTNTVADDPLLGPLQDNGGPTETHLPNDGSPAIDAGDNALAVGADSNPLSQDQRGPGFGRFAGGTVDIGSVEGFSPTPPDNFVVTTAVDENDGSPDPGMGAGTSLREAIIAANSDPNQSTITFAPSLNGTPILLTIMGADEDVAVTGDLDITQETIIEGNDPSSTVIDAGTGGGLNDRVFHILGAVDVSVSGVTVTGGSSSTGGGILNEGGTLRVSNSSVSANTASDIGGGIFNNGGTTNVKNSLISANQAARGGGLGNEAGASLSLSNSTVSGNTTSAGAGGGILGLGATSIVNSTVTANTANSSGGGLSVQSADLTIANSLVSGNSGATAFEVDLQSVNLQTNNNLIGEDTSTSAQAIVGFTLDASDLTATSDGTDPTVLSDILNVALANNGGLTQTHALPAGSPAINAGFDGSAFDADNIPLGTDQRGPGFDRFNDGTVDIGAFESESTLPAFSDIRFSPDGMNFGPVLTVEQGEEVWVRINYDNRASFAFTNAQASITLPAGVSLVANSTRTALTPAEMETVTNIDAGQSGAIDESAVWSGSTLTISPQAGLYAQPVDATSGILDIGKKRYINLHDCHYFNGAERFFTTADPDISGTNVSNTLDAAAACAGSVGAYGNAGQELSTGSLLGNRYLNYHEGHFVFLTDNIYRDAGDVTATRTSNTVDAAPDIAGTAGAHVLSTESTVENLDLHGNRYINLHEGRFINGGDLISLNLGAGGTNTSNTQDAGPSFPTTFGAYTLNDSDIIVLDTLDNTRGAGFVEFKIDTSAALGDLDFFALLADLSGNSEFTDHSDQGVLTVATPPPDTFVVDIATDEADGDLSPGDVSLRDAIIAANANPNPTTITFDPSLDGTPILLTLSGGGEDASATGDLDITTDITITGNGANNTIIDAGGVGGLDDRVFEVVNGSLTISDSTTRGGNGGGVGGFQVNSGSALHVLRAAITGNTGTAGGAVFGHSGSDITIVESTVSGNPSLGAGALHFSGTGLILNSTISGNTSDYGEIDNYGTGLTISNSTVQGRVYGYGGSLTTLNNTIVTGSAGGGGSFAGANNLFGTGSTHGLPNTMVGNAQLGPLQDNGGPTLTHIPGVGSPAIDAGDNALAVDADSNALPFDQRGPGFDRIIGSTVDIGAIETTPPDSFIVTTELDEDDGTADPGTGAGTSLREAIIAANANPNPTTITFDPALNGTPILLTIVGANEDLAETGDLDITTEVHIMGNGATNTVIDAGSDDADGDRIFDILAPVDVMIDALTLTGGRAVGFIQPGGQGAAIRMNAGSDVTIIDSELSGNEAGAQGGAIYSAGTLTVRDSTISGNMGLSGGGIFAYDAHTEVSGTTFQTNVATQQGGAIHTVGQGSGDTLLVSDSRFISNSAQDGGAIGNQGDRVEIDRTLFDDNSASNRGGAIDTVGGFGLTLMVRDSTFTHNAANSDDGGAIRIFDGSVIISGSTFANNMTDRSGGAIANERGNLSVVNSTLTANEAGITGGAINSFHPSGAIDVVITNTTMYRNTAPITATMSHSSSAPAVINNSIIAGCVGPAMELSGSFTGSNNIVEDGSGGLTGTITGDPLLGPLQDNGGPTETHAPAAGSPAIDAGDNALAVDIMNSPLTTDQRGAGFDRILDGGVNGLTVDIGAFEATAPDSFVVTTEIDENDGSPDPGTGAGTSLREAVIAANANPNATTITFDPSLNGTTIVLSITGGGEHAALQGDLDITAPTTIQGNGATETVIDAGGPSGLGERVFHIISAGDVSIDSLTITGGDQPGMGQDSGGGGIFVDSTTVVVSNSTITGSMAFFGGGIANYYGNLTVRDSTISANSTGISGAGIATSGTAEIIDTTITGNTAGSVGGGIEANGTVTVTGSTIEGNMANSDGGGITVGGTLTIVNSTVSGNSANESGGGIYTRENTITIVNSTITGNTAVEKGGGVAMLYDDEGGNGYYANVTVNNAIIAGNTAPENPDVQGDFTSNGANVIGDTGASSGFASDITGVAAGTVIDPTLADNGGPTETHALVAGSPAIDHGNNADAVDGMANPLATDQRGAGFDRVKNGTVDSGAFESDPPVGDTEVTLEAGVLTITDIEGGDSNDDLTISYNAGTYTLTDNGGLFLTTAIPGATGDETDTLTIPDTGVTSIVFDLLDGNDSILVSSLQASLPGGFTVNSGGGEDAFTLDGAIDTGAGDVSITVSQGITLNSGASITAGDGNITLSANQQPVPTNGNFAGIEIDNGVITSTGSGNIQLDGRGGTSAGNFIAGSGISIRGGGNVVSSGTGTVTLNGTGGPTGDENYGVRLTDPGTSVTSASGTLTIHAQAGGTIDDNPGIRLESSAVIQATGNAALHITGLASGTEGVGVAVFQDASIQAEAGPTTVNGTSTGDARGGVAIFRGGAVESTTGSVTINGTADDVARGVLIETNFGLAGTVRSTTGHIFINGTATGTGNGIEVTGAGSTVDSMGGRIILQSTQSIVAADDSTITNTTGDIILTTDQLEISGAASLQSSGNLTIRPNSPFTTIGLGGGAGTLNLDDTELSQLADGFNNITIGDVVAGVGEVNIDTAAFTDPITIAGGSIHDAAGTDIDAGTNPVTLIGNVAPGQSPGILNVHGDFVFGSGSTLEAEITGATPGTEHDQIAVVGTVDINNATLNIDDTGFTALGDEVLVLIDNDGTDAVVGTFNGLPEGTLLTVGGQTFPISYADGDGNDVVLGRACSFEVTTTDDDGFGSLRRAIECANEDAALDTITFNIPGPGPHTIQPLSALPTITNPVIIDGTTEPDFAGTPVIEIDGSQAGANVHGLQIDAGNSTLRGLAVNRFSWSGIVLAFAGGNTLQQNFVGTDPTGTAALPNGSHGIVVFNSPNNVIGGSGPNDGNVISGNGLHGVLVTHAGSTGNAVQGNRIGVAADGMTPLGNSRVGVRIQQTASDNMIGGSSSGEGNIIAHHTSQGVVVVGDSTGNAIRGNSIFSNGLLGIDLGFDDATANDVTAGSEDADSGPNLRQNTPELTLAALSGTDLDVTFTVPSGTAHAAYPLTVEFFIADPDSEEGEVFLAAETYDASSALSARTAMIDVTGLGLSGSSQIVATATDSAGNTSEFSSPGQVQTCSFEVTTTADAGFGSLRRAIECANEDAATDTITFNIPGAGPHTIQPLSALPIVTNPVIIDGTSEPDFAGTPVIELDGSNAGAGVHGLQIDGGGSTVRGLAVNRFSFSGIVLAFAGGNTLQQSFVGTDPTGTVALGNGSHGVVVFNSPNNVVGGPGANDGNVISGNALHGLLISHAGSTGNAVQGNLIGTAADGVAPLGNNRVGVRIQQGASDNTIGGSSAGEGNTIAHQTSQGVVVVGNSTGNAIRGNSIFSNGSLGIDLNFDGVTPNDVTPGSEDADTGPNQQQNTPVVTSAILNGTNLDVTFAVPSATAHSAFPLTVELFVADGAGQGRTLLSAVTYDLLPPPPIPNVTIDVTGLGLNGSTQIVGTATDGSGNTSEFSAPATVSVPLRALSESAASSGLSAGSPDELVLLHNALPSIVDAAVIRWRESGLSAEQLSSLQNIDISFAELDGSYLGLTTRNVIRLDTDAAGHGWYIDRTPLDDSEFDGSSSDEHVADRMDLLTAVMHELGHTMGFDDELDDSLAEDVMFAWLEPGARRGDGRLGG